VFLMLRRMSLTGDAMSHAILPGAAVGYLVAGLSLGAMTVGGLIAGLIVALLSGAGSRAAALRGDASLAAVYQGAGAAGGGMVSIRGSNVELLHVQFGTVQARDDAALWLLAGIATLTLLTLAAVYRPLVMECLDPGFLRAVSRASAPTHFVFLGLTVLNLVGGFQALGTLMSVGIMILPAAAARFWAASVGGMIAVATLTAAVASVAGLLASYHFGLPSGPAIILAAGAIYVVSLAAGREGGLLARRRSRRHLAA
jgi:zinc/manganese transport system permease protein